MIVNQDATYKVIYHFGFVFFFLRFHGDVYKT